MDDDAVWQLVGIALIAGIAACLTVVGIAGSITVGTCGGTWWGEGSDPYAPMNSVECIPIGTWVRGHDRQCDRGRGDGLRGVGQAARPERRRGRAMNMSSVGYMIWFAGVVAVCAVLIGTQEDQSGGLGVAMAVGGIAVGAIGIACCRIKFGGWRTTTTAAARAARAAGGGGA